MRERTCLLTFYPVKYNCFEREHEPLQVYLLTVKEGERGRVVNWGFRETGAGDLAHGQKS